MLLFILCHKRSYLVSCNKCSCLLSFYRQGLVLCYKYSCLVYCCKCGLMYLISVWRSSVSRYRCSCV